MENRFVLLVLTAALFFSACSSSNKTPSYDKKPNRKVASLPTLVNGREQFALWNNHKVRFEEFGHGTEEAIVFIHGWSCDSSFWNFQVNEFSARQRVITIDLPGHGKSARPSSVKYSVDEFADAINAVFETIGLAKAILVGHSLGGVVVRHFYRKHSDKVMALVIVDSEVTPWSQESVNHVRQKVSELKTPAYQKIAAEMVDEMFVMSTPEFLRDNIKRKMTSTSKIVMSKALLGLADQSLYKTDLIKVPTMIVMAKNQILRPDNERFLKSFIQDLDYQEWENVGHFVMMEDPERFNKAVLKFFLNKRF